MMGERRDMPMLAPMDPQQFMLHLFSSRAAREGGVIRRKVRDVERYVGRDAFLSEIGRRGFAVFENGGQFVIFCNCEAVRRLL